MSTPIGDKIKNLRLASDLTQEELADRAGLTKGFISQLERDLTSVGLDSLEDILIAMNSSLSDFFSETPEEQVVYTVDDRTQLTQEGVERFQLLVPGATNRNMEPALVILGAGESTEEVEPFTGEVFGFLIQGRVNLRLGEKRFKVKRGDSIYFTADKHHQLINNSQNEARFLWITCPPYF